MNRLKKISFLVSLTLSLSLLTTAGLSQTTTMDSMLGSIADTAKVEHVFCISRNLEAVEVTEVSTGANVLKARLCAEVMPLAVAVWHNHIFDGPSVNAPTAEGMCYFSLTDQNTFLRYEIAPVGVVQVNSRVKCWWSREQVRDGWEQHLVPLHPIPGQETK